jgi:hypothetical protein
MANAGFPDPSFAHTYFNDFDTYSPGDWIVTKVGTGTQGPNSADGGQLLLTTTAGAADANFMQIYQPGFAISGNKDAFFKFAGVISDVTNSVFYAGLLGATATPLAATDGVFIRKLTGSGALQLVSAIGGVSTVVNFPANELLVNGAAFEVGFHIDPQNNIEAFFNPTTGQTSRPTGGAPFGRSVSLLGNTITPVLTTPSFGHLNSTAAARTLGVDYVLASVHR